MKERGGGWKIEDGDKEAGTGTGVEWMAGVEKRLGLDEYHAEPMQF